MIEMKMTSKKTELVISSVSHAVGVTPADVPLNKQTDIQYSAYMCILYLHYTSRQTADKGQNKSNHVYLCRTLHNVWKGFTLAI